MSETATTATDARGDHSGTWTDSDGGHVTTDHRLTSQSVDTTCKLPENVPDVVPKCRLVGEYKDNVEMRCGQSTNPYNTPLPSTVTCDLANLSSRKYFSTVYSDTLLSEVGCDDTNVVLCKCESVVENRDVPGNISSAATCSVSEQFSPTDAAHVRDTIVQYSHVIPETVSSKTDTVRDSNASQFCPSSAKSAKDGINTAEIIPQVSQENGSPNQQLQLEHLQSVQGSKTSCEDIVSENNTSKSVEQMLCVDKSVVKQTLVENVINIKTCANWSENEIESKCKQSSKFNKISQRCIGKRRPRRRRRGRVSQLKDETNCQSLSQDRKRSPSGSSGRKVSPGSSERKRSASGSYSRRVVPESLRNKLSGGSSVTKGSPRSLGKISPPRKGIQRCEISGSKESSSSNSSNKSDNLSSVLPIGDSVHTVVLARHCSNVDVDYVEEDPWEGITRGILGVDADCSTLKAFSSRANYDEEEDSSSTLTGQHDVDTLSDTDWLESPPVGNMHAATLQQDDVCVSPQQMRRRQKAMLLRLSLQHHHDKTGHQYEHDPQSARYIPESMQVCVVGGKHTQINEHSLTTQSSQLTDHLQSTVDGTFPMNGNKNTEYTPKKEIACPQWSYSTEVVQPIYLMKSNPSKTKKADDIQTTKAGDEHFNCDFDDSGYTEMCDFNEFDCDHSMMHSAICSENLESDNKVDNQHQKESRGLKAEQAENVLFHENRREGGSGESDAGSEAESNSSGCTAMSDGCKNGRCECAVRGAGECDAADDVKQMLPEEMQTIARDMEHECSNSTGHKMEGLMTGVVQRDILNYMQHAENIIVLEDIMGLSPVEEDAESDLENTVLQNASLVHWDSHPNMLDVGESKLGRESPGEGNSQGDGDSVCERDSPGPCVTSESEESKQDDSILPPRQSPLGCESDDENDYIEWEHRGSQKEIYCQEAPPGIQKKSVDHSSTKNSDIRVDWPERFGKVFLDRDVNSNSECVSSVVEPAVYEYCADVFGAESELDVYTDDEDGQQVVTPSLMYRIQRLAPPGQCARPSYQHTYHELNQDFGSVLDSQDTCLGEDYTDSACHDDDIHIRHTATDNLPNSKSSAIHTSDPRERLSRTDDNTDESLESKVTYAQDNDIGVVGSRNTSPSGMSDRSLLDRLNSPVTVTPLVRSTKLKPAPIATTEELCEDVVKAPIALGEDECESLSAYTDDSIDHDCTCVQPSSTLRNDGSEHSTLRLCKQPVVHVPFYLDCSKYWEYFPSQHDTSNVCKEAKIDERDKTEPCCILDQEVDVEACDNIPPTEGEACDKADEFTTSWLGAVAEGCQDELECCHSSCENLNASPRRGIMRSPQSPRSPNHVHFDTVLNVYVTKNDIPDKEGTITFEEDCALGGESPAEEKDIRDTDDADDEWEEVEELWDLHEAEYEEESTAL